MQRPLTSEERLEILRVADSRREWHSLDDQRACPMCHVIFSGRQVEILRDQRGRVLLKSPSEECNSCVPDWLYTRSSVRAAA